MANRVPGHGPKDANLMIVGEAPGKKEDRTGKPFVGKSGKLLTKLMNSCGIHRGWCYITNVIKERPPGNNINKFLNPKKGYISDAAQKYIRQLEDEVREVDPNLIVPVGSTALWALTSNKSVTKWRGSILEGYLGYKTIPIIHPAAALRYYPYRYYILFDLKTVAEEMDTPKINRKDRRLIIEPSESDTYLDKCFEHDRVAFDIEVDSSEEISCISFSFDESHAISIPLKDRYGKNYLSSLEEKRLLLKIAELLEDDSVSIVAHNATFDTNFLYRKYGIKTSNIEDTMVAQGILYPDFDKDLGFLTSMYTDIPYYKDELKESFEAQNNEMFWKYNAKDSIVLLECFRKQVKELKAQENLETYKHQRNLIEPLLFMTEHGMNIDSEGMQRRSNELAVEIRGLENELINECGKPINPQSPKQLKEYFYEEEGLKAYKSRKTGNPTTNEKALKRIKAKGYKEADLILKIRGLQKFKGTYLDAKLSEDGRLRSSFNPVGTTTGRLSSSKDIFDRGMNVQNLPYKMRKFIQPDEGYVMYEIDLGQAENRIVAYGGPSPNMMQAFEEGMDIHCRTAGLVFGMDWKEVQELEDEYEEVGKPEGPNEYCPDIGQGNKTYRDWGKQANHAFNYGMKYRKAALNWEIPEKEAKWIYERYHEVYPGVQDRFHNWIDASLNKNRTIENLLGRKRKFFKHWNTIKKDAYAHFAQSTVADIINRYGVCGIYYDQERFSEVTLLSQVHDSVWIQIPRQLGWAEHERLLSEVCDLMEPTLNARGGDFVIPAEVTMFPQNASKGHEFEGRPSETQLEETFVDLS